MTYLAVNELKRSKDVWNRLVKERELIVTRDGKPCALLIGVSPSSVDSDLAEIRRALFSSAVSRARKRARGKVEPDRDIRDLVRKSRRDRGVA